MDNLEIIQDVLNNKNAQELYDKAYTHTGNNRAIYLLQAANLGHTQAQETREHIYLFVKYSDPIFVTFITMTASQGYPDSLNTLARLYEDPSCIKSNNIIEAKKFYEKAVEQDYFQAYFNLAKAYIHGEGVEKDCKQGKILLEKAAKLGSLAAINSLGYAYYMGTFNGENDNEKAIKYFKEGANKNHIPCIKNLIAIFKMENNDKETARYEKKLEEVDINPLY